MLLHPVSLAKTRSAWKLAPRVTLLHAQWPQASLENTGMVAFGKLLIRKVARERGVLTRDTLFFNVGMVGA
jgi:hypothetical protein